MASLLSSPARLIDATAVGHLKAHLCEHGALGHRRALRAVPLTELEKFQLVPLVFGLMPKGVFAARRPEQPIKPIITAHLLALGINPDALLLDVLKSVCDQFWETRKDNSQRYMKQKFGMRDVRPMRRTYLSLVSRQGGRCSLCGADLRNCVETLDHVVPYRIIGDVLDGSNWEIQCEPCNSSKGTFVSALQAVQAHNWIYMSPDASFPLEHPSLETRFLVLAQAGKCTVAGCAVTPRAGALHLRKARESGLAIADNLVVRCTAHLHLS